MKKGNDYYIQKYIYLKNLQNDIIGILDNNGNIVVQYYYEAYGNLISTIDTSGIGIGSINPFRYRSYYYDSETGWYYLNSRFYDPLIKRFITLDDISYLGSSGSAISYNLYSYCENNPVVLADYNGNDAIYVCIFDWPEGLPVVGHAQLYYEIKKDVWWCTEFTLNKYYLPTVFNYPVGSKKLIRNYLDSTKHIEHYMIGKFARISEFANKYVGFSYYLYNFVFNNCLRYVHMALNYAFYGNDKLRYKPLLNCIPKLYNPNQYFQTYNVSALPYMITYYTGGGGNLYDCISPIEHIISRYR